MKGNNQQELSYRAIETQVVGQVLTGTPQDWDIANSIVKAEDFTEPMYTIMWQLFTELANAGQGINVTNFYALALTRYDHEKCVDMVLTDVVNGYGDMALLAESVAATAMKRRYFEAITMMSDKMMEPDYTVEEANAELREVININEGRTAGIKTIGQTMHDLLLDTQDKMNGIEKPKVLTGFRYIDNRGGLKAGNLDIIAGRTSNGKTRTYSSTNDRSFGCSLTREPRTKSTNTTASINARTSTILRHSGFTFFGFCAVFLRIKTVSLF